MPISHHISSAVELLQRFGEEDAVLADQGDIAAAVYSMELLGDSSMVTMQVGGGLVAIKAAKDFNTKIGAPLAARVPARICHLFDPATGQRIEWSAPGKLQS